MDDLWVRLSLIAGALIVAGLVTVMMRLRAKGGPRKLHATGLGQGVYLFSSTACPDCKHVRRMLDDAFGGDGYREFQWEQEPGLFHDLGVDAVPATVIVEFDGSGVLWPGRPDKALASGR
jgi:hypothetical protein